MNKVIAPATAADVRAWFAENPQHVPAEAAHTVDRSAKGRIHPAAREAFNEHSGMTYDEGTPKCVPLQFHKVDKIGRKQPRVTMLPVAEIRTLAGKAAGGRGRLSEAALAAAGEAYSKRINKQ